MCWITYNKNNLDHVIASKDIPIYKIMHFKREFLFKKKFISAFRDFQYKLGETYSGEMGIPRLDNTVVGGRYYIDRGFHSYNPLVTYITKGRDALHSIDIKCRDHNIGGFLLDNNLVILYGYIPRGACYHENEDGECVSNAIKLTHYKKITGENLNKLV